MGSLSHYTREPHPGTGLTQITQRDLVKCFRRRSNPSQHAILRTKRGGTRATPLHQKLTRNHLFVTYCTLNHHVFVEQSHKR